MASVFQRPESPYWFCSFQAADGRWLKRSTKCREKKKALEFTLRLAQAEQEGRQGVLTEARARELIGEVIERVNGQSIQFFTAHDWFQHWLETKKEAKAARTGERYAHVIDKFLAFLGGKSRLNISAIDERDLLAFRKTRLESGCSNRTCNLDIKIIGAALNAAYRSGYIKRNPALALDSLPTEGKEKGTFTAEQFNALVGKATGDWRGAIVLGFYTGARLRDVCDMRWDSIDFENRIVRYKAEKTKRKVDFPMPEQLENFLFQWKGGLDDPKGFLFPSLAGKSGGGRSGLSRQFAAIMSIAGIDGGATRPQRGQRSVSHLSFHSFRHGFNSALLNAGHSLEIREALGMATGPTNSVYSHTEIETLRRAVSSSLPKLPRLK